MKLTEQKPPRARAISLLAASLSWACLAWTSPGLAAAKATASGASAAVPAYEKAVPAPLQSLVNKEEYQVVVDELTDFNHRQTGTDVFLFTGADIALAAGSPCHKSLLYLTHEYYHNPKVKVAYGQILSGLQDLPPAYKNTNNPWHAKNTDALQHKLVKFFTHWCTDLPRIRGSYDDGLNPLQHFAWFYYHNPAGQDFVQGRDPDNQVGFQFTKNFTLELGKFMDSSASTKTVAEWIADPTIEIHDYQLQKASNYHSWNQFFARELIIDKRRQTIPSRPVTMPERDFVVVAPTDCIMNPLLQVLQDKAEPQRKYLDNPLQLNTVLDVKGIPLSLAQLLSGVEERYRQPFVGGSGQSCILMPNTYHHFHAPVDGQIVHASIVKTNTFGYPDWPNWVPTDGNVARPGTDFSQFQAFQRGIVIIEVTYNNLGKETKGYVASIPVGLDSVGSVVLNANVKPGLHVKKGYTELGNFFYGGSIDIILYSKGLASGVTQVRMGNQINLFNLGKHAP